MLAPSFSLPVGLVRDFASLADGLEDAAGALRGAFRELDEAAHELRQVVVPVTRGQHIEQRLVRHVDQVAIGNDSFVGGEGDDVLVGDRWVRIDPRITVTTGGTSSGCDDRHDDECGDDHSGNGCCGDWFQATDDDSWTDDTLVEGNDSMDGGKGVDLLIGDSAALVSLTVSSGPGLREGDFRSARGLAEEVLETLVGESAVADSCSSWCHSNDGAPDLYVESGGDPDLMLGGEGDDMLLGQGGNDILHGDAGNDWLVGGGGQDTIDGGTGHDRISYGDDWSSELRQKVLAGLAAWLGRLVR